MANEEVVTNPASKYLGKMIEAGIIDEWWSTADPNTFVVCGEHLPCAKVTVTPENLPEVPPSTWMDSQDSDNPLPHPFGWNEPAPGFGG